MQVPAHPTLCLPPPDFLRHMFPKLEWAAFLEGARAVRGALATLYTLCWPVHAAAGRRFGA